MTTEIKAAIAGAIEALDRVSGMCDISGKCACGRPNGVPAVKACADKALPALRRIEFVGGRDGHAIVRMGEPIELAEPYLNNGRGG